MEVGYLGDGGAEEEKEEFHLDLALKFGLVVGWAREEMIPGLAVCSGTEEDNLGQGGRKGKAQKATLVAAHQEQRNEFLAAFNLSSQPFVL